VTEKTLFAKDMKLSIRSDVITQLKQVAEEQDKQLAPLADNLPLLESGLDSLCFAIIVSRLEDSLGIDPFSAAEDIPFPVTLGEFISFYENAAR
jgi:acyl carrier protein